MKKLWSSLKSALNNRIFITFIGVLALTIIIWFGGPLLAIGGYEPWKSETSRLVTLLVIALIWGFANFRHKLKTEKSNKEIMDHMLDPGDAALDSTSKEEISYLQGRMQEALQILKNSKMSQGKNLYSLPWYIIIGPPGSGKTTALNNSGLNFPLKEQMGIDAVHGIGGTRNCDWWFTDRAIMLDTAGRYTTQDSNAQADSNAWIGFLELLKKNRPRRPINGVLVTVSLTDLATQTPTERSLYARAIKQRLQELHNRLAINFPIYVMFTKADLVSGFNEFFDDLSREEREQVWGITFTNKPNESEGVVSEFNKYFMALIQRANERVFSLLNHERDPERRCAIYEFPKQLRAMQDSMDVFLKEIFSPNKFEQNPLLRGVYIASATQEGTPIDRVIGKFAEGLGLAARQPISHSGDGKGYFLKRLFDEIIFPEQNLATANHRLEKRELYLRRGAIAAGALVLVSCLIGWTYSYRENVRFKQTVEAQIDNYQALTNGGLTEETDLITLNEGLLSLRRLPNGYETEQSEIPAGMQWGLYQGDKIGEQATDAYTRGIENIFVPYVISVLEKQISNNMAASEFLYASLKFYLMLRMPEKMDKELFSLWLGQEWARLLPGKVNDEIRSNLMEHLRVALDSDIRIPRLDSRLIEQTREELQSTSLAQRAYVRLKEDVVDITPPGFRITDILNARKARLFTRKSGRSLNDEIPGLFTYAGYHGVFRIEGNSLLKRLAEESWIYGKEFEDQLKKENLDALYAEVEDLYFEEYINLWRGLIDDVELDGFTSAQEGENVLRQLTTGRKPIQALADAIIKNIQLTNVPENNVDKKLGQLADATPEGLENTRLAREKNRLERLIPKNINQFAQQEELPGKQVETEFSDILYFSLGDAINGDKPQSEEIMPALENLEKYLKLLADRDGGSVALESINNGSRSVKRLKDFSNDFPRPFNQWVGKLAQDTSNLTTSGAQQHISSIWRNTVLREYNNAISGRYPLVKNSRKTIKLNDFKRFFGYGGTLDKFFNQHLASFVDKTQSPWTFKKYIGVKNSSLRQFQRADRIKRMFFQEGSQQLKVDFSLIPKFLDTQVSQFILEIDKQVLTYRHGPARPVPFTWPGENSGISRFVFTPHNGGKATSVTVEGPWSWFKMLDLVSEKKSTSSDKINLKFLSKGNEAIVELVTDSVVNPFDTVSLERFRCPQQL
ncbi:type VI secretion system membrane subunit TssM [Aliikangiella maris]|uniref:Type VI secretion system membrane subunit TssM n=2 Tax=Aliikangiella maris TaxID=3162458 RepID=A0ABV3MNC4_9GAMM